ncbi:ABC transporter ATP-binding protein [Allobaculum mucilyticum]|uniref:ABC transporter ATP-binding protein n=1 Tax=Allobaculum mucilyticum TaxID=2834459 RepID=UPI001E46A47E|nr:ABC transporter ATP-binding protein [Allobaculum mucilyticum]UNT95173.1 ABC transporter ATP-binding protein [Allobaculum mucilyticum]
MPILEASHLRKIYSSRFSATQVEALSDVTFQVQPGEFIAIMGESGSGKSTLLNILAGIDRPTAGEVRLNGSSIQKLSKRELAAFRRNHLGFIFQDYCLLDTFNNEDNILLPLVLNGERRSAMTERLSSVARRLDITDLLRKYPYEISGGQKQRVAVARAMITGPAVLLADEPTGALDSKSSEQLLSLFETLNRQGQTIVMVTHSSKAASYASRVLFIQDGRIFHQIFKGDQNRWAFYEKINDTLNRMAGASHA